MMPDVDKDIERLIVLCLDDELSPDEELRLNRELIRNPDAQRMFEAYRRIDTAAASALHDALQPDQLLFDPKALTHATEARRRLRPTRTWWLLPGAIAAALLAVMVARWPTTPPAATPPSRVDRMAQGRPGGHPSDTPAVTPSFGGHALRRDDLMRSTGTAPMIQRHTGRKVIGVLGENGKLYLLEVDRTRTLRRFVSPGGSRGGKNTM
jgi:hypothetical protein